MSWFHSPIDKKAGTWSKVYTDNFVNEAIISFSAPVIINDRVIAIVGIDL